MRAGTRRRRALLAALLGLALLLAADQIAQHVLLADGTLRGRRIAPFDPPLFTEHQEQRIAEYAALVASGEVARAGSNFDAELGWCPRPSTEEGEARFDQRGARIGTAPVPVARTPGVRRVVAVGCSFTLGAKVAGPESWVARVDEARADVEVVNLAFGGFGLDQALLRWRRDGERERPDEVWLGVLPSAAPRNVTTYVPAMRHWSGFVGVKPRFVLDERGELALVRSPARSLAELVALVRSQSDFVAAVGAHDHWVRRAPAAYAPRGSHWTHAFATTRLALTMKERGGRESSAYLLDARSEVRRIESAIVRELRREVEARGAHLRVFVLPDRLDLTDRAERGHGYWSDLVGELVRDGVDVYDASDALAAVGADTDLRYWVEDGHYSAEGNRVVAEAIARRVGPD